MDTTTFDTLTRSIITVTTRRSALGGLFAGAIATVSGAALLPANDTTARRKRKKNKKKKRKDKAEPSSPPPVNVCEAKNWCIDRTQTCGPTGGYGKCMVDATGDNLCAEILFQAATCAACEAPKCTNCQCALAAGGGDRCNNGATGYDFICVRPI